MLGSIDLGSPVERGHPFASKMVTWLMGLPGQQGFTLRDLCGPNHAAIAASSVLQPLPGGFCGLRETTAAPSSAACASAVGLPVSASAPFSISFTFMPVGAQGGTGPGFFGYGASAKTNNGHRIACNQNGEYAMWGEFADNTSGVYLDSDSQWHTIVWTHDGGSSLKLYRDGVLGSTMSRTYTGDAGTRISMLEYGFGFGTSDWPDVRMMHGMIHARAITLAEAGFLHDQARRGWPDLLRRITRRAWMFGGTAGGGGGGNRRRRLILCGGS